MKSHYPDFDVMRQKDEWDDNTRNIVMNRLKDSKPLSFFSLDEVGQLEVMLETILCESREDILSYIISWYDQKLSRGIGEGDREQFLPPEGELVKRGLALLGQAVEARQAGESVNDIVVILDALLWELQQGTLEETGEKWPAKEQKAFFKAIRVNSVKAYYSHPTIWSEIGYAGPAYPRGYVRSELGVTDPWEAKRHDA